MDSIKIIKGYNKVDQNHPNHPLPPPPPQHKRISEAATVAIILCVVLFTALILIALVRNSTTESQPSPNSAESIKTVCGVTPYPDTCFKSLISLNQSQNPDPESIFKLSLHLTIDSLKNASSLFKSLNERQSEAALQDCAPQIDDALSRVNDSLSEMEVAPGERTLTDRKVNDIQTWISAAMTDQEACLDGLEEMGSTAIDQVKDAFGNSKEFLSISLAIIAKINLLLQKFGLSMH